MTSTTSLVSAFYSPDPLNVEHPTPEPFSDEPFNAGPLNAEQTQTEQTQTEQTQTDQPKLEAHPSRQPSREPCLEQPPVPLPQLSLSLWEHIREDWIAHRRDWTLPGFRAVAVYRFGVWRMGIQPRLLRLPFSMVYNFLFRYVRNHYGIELPYTTLLGRRVIIEHQGSIVIHGYCEIGDDSILRQGVTLGNRYLERPYDAPKLGKRVNVGAGAKLFGAIAVGDGANIGANAVVLNDIPAHATAVGIPARVLAPKSS